MEVIFYRDLECLELCLYALKGISNSSDLISDCEWTSLYYTVVVVVVTLHYLEANMTTQYPQEESSSVV